MNTEGTNKIAIAMGYKYFTAFLDNRPKNIDSIKVKKMITKTIPIGPNGSENRGKM